MTQGADLSREAVRERVKASKARQKAQVKQKRRDVLASAIDTVDWRKAKRVLLADPAPGLARDVIGGFDINGRPAQPYRLNDTLRALARGKYLTAGQYQAGRRFEGLAEVGETLRSSPMERIGDSSGGDRHNPTIMAAEAQHAMSRAMAAVGGQGSTPARVVWLVLAEGHTLVKAAERLKHLPNGKEGEKAAKWLLIGALDILAVHWRYSRAE